MRLRQAHSADLPAVWGLFRRAIDAMLSQGIDQWDDVYPNEDVLRRDIDDDDMWLIHVEDGIVGSITLNTQQDAQYREGHWLYDADSAAVVHRLCIDPAHQNKGYARELMLSAQNMLRQAGYASVRLDAFSQNLYALRLYESLGYRRVGQAEFRKGLFYLYEKRL